MTTIHIASDRPQAVGELGSLFYPDPGAAKMVLEFSDKSYIQATWGYILLLCLVPKERLPTTTTSAALHRWVLFVCFMDEETEALRTRNLPKPCSEKNPRLQNPGLCASTMPSPRCVRSPFVTP